MLYNRMINEAYKQDLMDRAVVNVKVGDIVEDLGGERYTVEKVSKNYYDVEDSDKGKTAKRWIDDCKEAGCNLCDCTWVAVVDESNKKHVYVYGDSGVTKVVDAAFKVQQLAHVKEHTSVMDGYMAVCNEDLAPVVIGQESEPASDPHAKEEEEDEDESETAEEESEEQAEGDDDDDEEIEEEEEDDEESEDEDEESDEDEEVEGDENEIAASDADEDPAEIYPINDEDEDGTVKESVKAKNVAKKTIDKINPVKAKGKSLKMGKVELKSKGFEKVGKAGKKAKKSKKAKK